MVEKSTNIDELLDSKYGVKGSPERNKFEAETKLYYLHQMLLAEQEAAKEENRTPNLIPIIKEGSNNIP